MSLFNRRTEKSIHSRITNAVSQQVAAGFTQQLIDARRMEVAELPKIETISKLPPQVHPELVAQEAGQIALRKLTEFPDTAQTASVAAITAQMTKRGLTFTMDYAEVA